MRMTRLSTGVTWVFLIVTVAGQAKPDFSGRWTLTDPPPNQADSSMTVSQDATTVTIVSPSPDAVLQSLTLKLDGTPTRFTVPRTGREHEAHAKWTGDRLVISIEAYSNQHGSYTVVLTWSLEGDRLTAAVAMISRTTGATFSEGKMNYRRS